MNIAIALVAAALVGAGLVLQQQSARQAPPSYFLHLRLFTELLKKRRWLAGIAIMISGQLLSMWAIGHLELTVAEPLLATNLIFALLLAMPLTGQRVRRIELAGAMLLAGGVGALSVSRSVGAASVHFGSPRYWWAAAVVAAIALLAVRAGWRRSGQRRAILTGVAAGLIYGISDALTRLTVQTAAEHGFGAVLTSWSAWSLVGASICGLWLMESSFNSGPLNASLPAITAAEPVAGICLGVVVFGDVIRISPGMIALQSAGIAALIIGVILVARARMLGSLRPALPHPALPHVPHPALPHPGLAHPGLPHHALSHPVLPQPVLPAAAREVLERLTPARGPFPAPQSPEA